MLGLGSMLLVVVVMGFCFCLGEGCLFVYLFVCFVCFLFVLFCFVCVGFGIFFCLGFFLSYFPSPPTPPPPFFFFFFFSFFPFSDQGSQNTSVT